MRYSEKQIISFIRQHKAGVKCKAICHKLGISRATFYRWRIKYGGLEVRAAKCMLDQEHQNTEHKKILEKNLLELEARQAIYDGLLLHDFIKSGGSAVRRRRTLRKHASHSKQVIIELRKKI
ncbi:transposase [Alcanivorax sp. 1008]|uniref:transposase n=1 Tax=Alcanivorax sp. 1008 TaxID=2816853 RepID=UPI001DF95407|nr:transposase [Alcanivorax sp. 1008]